MIDWRAFLTSDPEICDGQLCASGTRVFVTNILDSLAEGAAREEILGSYPSLRPEHIDAALAYAAELAREESLLPLRASGGSSWTSIYRASSATTSGRSAMTRTPCQTRDSPAHRI